MTYSWHTANERIPEQKERLVLERQQRLGHSPPPAIEVSTIESWQEIGIWYNSLQKDRVVPGPAIKAKVLELTKDLTSTDDKLKALYEYVSTNFRYISIDFGIGRYQPHAAEQVFSNGYGDCKDKHTLLAAMLQAAGIEAFPALISSTRNIDSDVPSLAQFDHVITAIPQGKDFVFLDTTAEVAPYGMLLAPLRNKQVLVIPAHEGAKFAGTPSNPPFPVRETFELNGKVDESGTMNAEVSRFVHGDSEVMLKEVFRQAPPSKYRDMIQAMSYATGFRGEVSEVKLTGIRDINAGLRWDYHYHRPDYFDMSDQTPKNSLPLSLLSLLEMKEAEESLRLYSSPGELVFKCRVELQPSRKSPIGIQSARAAEAHGQLGFAYLATGRNDQAIAELKKAAEINPFAHRPHYLLGFHYSQQKDYSNAAPELEKALATEDPKYQKRTSN